jgi:putative membrane protein
MLKPAPTEAAGVADAPPSLWTVARAFWPPLPVWRRLDATLVVVAAYTGLVVLLAGETGLHLPAWGGGATILNAIVLGMLLGLRNREAYDRWWEARKLWGQLINDSRSLFSKVAALPGLSAVRSELGRLVTAFAIALKHRLRGVGGGLRRLPTFEASEEDPAHAPLFLFCRLTALLQTERAAGRLSEMDLLLLDPHVRSLMEVCGGCERIKNTPIPLSYRALVRHGLVLYLLSAPWFVADHLGWYAVPLIALLGYFLLGTELTAEDVEEPFGRAGDDLALSAYCETIRRSAEQAFG